MITRPTRITSNTATLIDNIFTNNLNNFSVSGLSFCDISDHLPIFTLLLDQNKNLNKTSWLSFRDKSGNNVAKFKDRLSNVHWDELSECIKILIAFIGVFSINTLLLSSQESESKECYFEQNHGELKVFLNR